ncbi:MAG: ABC transporter permease [Kofleriaceae bacterium]
MSWARRFAGNRSAMVGALLVIGLVVMSLLGVAPPHDPLVPDIQHGLTEIGAPLPPLSGTAVLGTDHFGRDVWSRLVTGAGTSLTIAALATVISMLIGVVVGLVAGYFGGWVDNGLMRLVDLVLAFPMLLLAILLAALLREADLAWSSAPIVVTLAAVGWTATARVVRAKAMVLARSEMVVAARSIGAGPMRVMVNHLAPNVLGVIVVLAAMGFAQNLLAESVLSYLGLGLPAPHPTWGTMLYEGRAYYRTSPHLVIIPGLAIVIAVIGFKLVAEGLRSVADPGRELVDTGDRA